MRSGPFFTFLITISTIFTLTGHANGISEPNYGVVRGEKMAQTVGGQSVSGWGLWRRSPSDPCEGQNRCPDYRKLSSIQKANLYITADNCCGGNICCGDGCCNPEQYCDGNGDCGF